ncbi:response regulator [Bacillus alkalicellulosilyticus]|uniref:response regulator n=1 Tax=Alkalihalobacterium alkalicellulosilyticum TaxID=1912214 RepID=UPI0009984F90|nr:response regulator [Bacillus alkalicellulosilyticus]
MYRVLIVDDEGLERRGLRKIIAEAFSHLLIEEADNGRTAILLAEEFRPNIVFMDIKMPGIDGVEAARELKRMNPSVYIIMVTAFDTFEYARQVMKIGVKDYILKPCSREEIIIPFQKALDEIESEKRKRTEDITLRDNYRRALSVIQSKVITSILMGSSHHHKDIEWDVQETFQKDSFVMVFEFNRKSKFIDYKEIKGYLSFIQSEIEQIFPNHFIGEQTMGRFPILVQLPEKGSYQNIRDRAIACSREIISRSHHVYPDYSLSIGIGRTYNELEKFIQSYHEALFALASIKQPNTCQYYNHHAKEQGNQLNLGYPYQAEKKLLESITSGSLESVATLVHNFMDEMLAYCNQSEQTIEEVVAEFLVLMRRHLVDCGITVSINRNLLHYNTVSIFQEEIIRITTYIHSMYHSKQKDVLLIAKQFMAENYKKPITLEEVAEQVELTPQYFSKIFKTRVGSSFIDYLTALRVETAKELMRTKKVSVKEVCYEVGYKDPNYFSRVFKKHTGMSPSDYR